MSKYRFYKLMRAIGKPIFKLLYRPTVINKKKMMIDGPVILCGNHTSNLDCFLLIDANKRVIHFLAKKELFTKKMNKFFTSMGCIPVDRSKKNPDALKSAINYLKMNEVIGIFPEGTINKTSDVVMPFKYGAVKMAIETKATIVPFSITGEYKKFKKSITLTYGIPYKVTSDDIDRENNILMNKVSELIITAREEKN